MKPGTAPISVLPSTGKEKARKALEPFGLRSFCTGISRPFETNHLRRPARALHGYGCELLVIEEVDGEAGAFMSGDVRLVSQRAAESVYVEVDDFRRRAGRGDESAGGAVPLAVVAEFLQRRNILEGRITLRIEDAEDAEDRGCGRWTASARRRSLRRRTALRPDAERAAGQQCRRTEWPCS